MEFTPEDFYQSCYCWSSDQCDCKFDEFDAAEQANAKLAPFFAEFEAIKAELEKLKAEKLKSTADEYVQEMSELIKESVKDAAIILARDAGFIDKLEGVE